MLLGLLLAVSLRAAHELVGAGVLPAMVRDLGGESWAGAFFAVYGLAAAAGIVAFGRASDRWSSARALGTALAAFAAGMTGTGLAPSMPLVVAARALEGFGGGGITVVVSAAVMRGYDDAARPRVLAWLSAAWVVPGLVAPALAVGVAETIGWRAVFLGLAPVVALAAVLVLPGMRREAAPGASAADRAAAGTERAIARSVWGAAPALLGALAVRGLLVFAFFGVESFLPLAFSTVRAAGAAEVGALLTLSALGWTTGAFLHARACRRWRAPVLARAGATALVAGIAVAVAGLFTAAPIAVALAGWAVAGLGMGVAYQTATDGAMAAARTGAEGATGAALGLTDTVASGVATATGGALLAAAPLAPGTAPASLLTAFALAAAMAAASFVPARRMTPAHLGDGPAFRAFGDGPG